MTPSPRRRRATDRISPALGESGQVTGIFVILAGALFLLGALIYDGGQILTARRQADNLARQAARAGAQALDVGAVRVGDSRLDPFASDAAARAFLDRRRLAPASVVVGVDDISVTVRLIQPTPLLALVGIESRTVTATATARSARGVREEGR